MWKNKSEKDDKNWHIPFARFKNYKIKRNINKIIQI